MGKKNKKKDDFMSSLYEINSSVGTTTEEGSMNTKDKASKTDVKDKASKTDVKDKASKQVITGKSHAQMTNNKINTQMINSKTNTQMINSKTNVQTKVGKKGKMSIDQIKKMMEENERKKLEHLECLRREEERLKQLHEEKEARRIIEEEEERKRILEAQEQKKVDEEKQRKLNEENEKIKKNEEEKHEMSRTFSSMCINSKKEIEKNSEAVDIGSELKLSTKHKSPICCILGHVDTGKTKLLDKLRESNVQEKEAGGITQQIGATFFPAHELAKKCGRHISDLPGILVIDTPGHESFTNLRSRGSSICNLAILVVDIVHGIEPQTLESIELLKSRKTPFIVALNKIDRIYGWKSVPFANWKNAIDIQSVSTKQEFKEQLNHIIMKFATLGLNAALFCDNPNDKKYISFVPTSAISGEGIPDLVSLILELSDKYMKSKMIIKDEVECTILEVKNTEGFGYTLDVILSNGELHAGDKIGFSTTDGPLFTTIRTLLIPQPLKELRVKSRYEQVKNARASLGVKIFGHECDKAIAGSRVYVVDGNEKEILDKLEVDLQSVMSSIELSELGVHVVASTLGSLEALLSFLKKSNVSVSNISVGTLKKKDLMIIQSVLQRNKEHGCVLCFDTELDRDTKEAALKMGIRIFEAKIIYHLLDQYTKYVTDVKNNDKQQYVSSAIFPVKLAIVPNCIFTKRSPLILGVEVIQGTLKMNVPLCVVNENGHTKLGHVVSIENNKKQVEYANKGDKIAIKIESNESAKIYGRDFDMQSEIYSIVTRKSIDTLKQYFRDELNDEHLSLLLFLKNKFDIV